MNYFEPGRDEGIFLTNAGNTQNPAALVLRARGYQMKWALDDDGCFSMFYAYRDGHTFVSETPETVLGLTAIYEQFGVNWYGGEFILGDLPTIPYEPYEDEDSKEDVTVPDGL